MLDELKQPKSKTVVSFQRIGYQQLFHRLILESEGLDYNLNNERPAYKIKKKMFSVNNVIPIK